MEANHTIRRATIRDVARLAGVSHQTVSRVINDHRAVAEPTREKVEEAIRLLGYVPSSMARGLASNRTHTIGLVSTDISDYFFAQAAGGAEVEARRHGYYLLIASVEEHAEPDERAYMRLMLERRVEGLIIARPKLPISPDRLRPRNAPRVPLLAIGAGPTLGLTVVDVDNRRGGLEATSLLIDLGHRSIATICGPSVWPSAHARLEGYRHALADGGVPYEERLVESAPGWGLASGQKAAARLLTRGVRFTAIFAQSDLLAIGAIKELRAHGIGVPEEVSVVGYDDIPVASFVDPPLTTVHQPMTEVGKRAVSLVLHAVGKDEAEPTVDLLPVRLVIRDSAVPPP